MLNTPNNRRFLRLIAIFFMMLVLVGCKEKVQAKESKADATAEKNQPYSKALSILYAGHPGSEREKDFVEFLSKYFKSVETGDFKTFKDSDANGYDVTILDYDGDGFKAPRPNISRNFSKPVVTMGVVGAFVCSSQGLKTGYL